MAVKPCEVALPKDNSSETVMSPAQSSCQAEFRPKQSVRSPAQVAASRANAKHSTGPRTQAGKARSRRNALRHGFYATQFTGPLGRAYEEVDLAGGAQAMRQIGRDFRRQYRPCTPEEMLIVDRIAGLWHRLQRIQTASQVPLRHYKKRGKSYRDAILETETLLPMEARLERSIARLHKILAFFQRMRLGRPPRWGVQDLEWWAEDDAASEAADANAAMDPELDPDDIPIGAGTRSAVQDGKHASRDVVEPPGALRDGQENPADGSDVYNENEGTNPKDGTGS